MIICGTKRVGKTRQWIHELLANAPQGAVYYSPIVQHYFDKQFLNLTCKADGKLVQVAKEHRHELIRLTH
ncbi:hypothetical protein TUMSATVNIG1_59660 (plasmid) [Vibrio nigripulchritudo]|nr:hypothetical protein VNTUMSATTG_59170 [Vibrio nigripulchritudo]BDU35357.1 hypothetical protein TUMSATVNIG1_59660 [Vibrio nigripulchritudo]